MSTKRYLSSQERRDKTVETVVELCATDDPATITTAEIAKHMQVTQGALFRHFPNKEAIWEAVAAWVAERVMARVTAAAEGIDDPLAALEAIFIAHIGFIADHPGVPRLVVGQLQHPRSTPANRVVRRLLENYHRRLLVLFGKAHEEGRLRPGMSVDAAAVQFIGTVQGLVMQSLIAGDVKRIVDLAPAAFDLFLNGVRDRRESTS